MKAVNLIRNVKQFALWEKTNNDIPSIKRIIVFIDVN